MTLYRDCSVEGPDIILNGEQVAMVYLQTLLRMPYENADKADESRMTGITLMPLQTAAECR
jgi:hypothetical protein